MSISRDAHAMSIGFGLGALAILVFQAARSAWGRRAHDIAERKKIERRANARRWSEFKDTGGTH